MRRDNRYDFYKGILMLGVIFGHVLTALQNGEGSTLTIHAFVRTYDMPMFALISGYFLKFSCDRHALLKNILGKIGGIMFPALLWSFLFNLIGGRIAINIGHFWFLTAIFSCSIIVIVADHIGKRTSSAVTAVLLIIAIGVFHTTFMDNYHIGFLLVPCVFGYYMEDMKRLVTDNRQKSFVKSAIVSVFIILWCFWKTEYNVWDTGCDIFKDGQILANIAAMSFRGLIGITGSLSMMWLWSSIYRCVSTSLVCDWICRIGKNTAELYILHSWVVTVAGARVVNILVELVGTNIFLWNERLLVWVFAPIVTVVSTVVVYLLQLYIKKISVIGKYAFSFPIIQIFFDKKSM